MDSEVLVTDDIMQEFKRVGQARIKKTLERRVYNPDDVNAMINIICDETTQALQRTNSNFKYVAHCAVMQRASPGETEASFIHQNTAIWNAQTDGVVVVKWENASMICLLSIFCLAL